MVFSKLIELGLWGVVIGHVMYFKSKYATIIAVYAGSKMITSLIGSLGDSNKTNMIKACGNCIFISAIVDLLAATLNWFR